MLTLEELEFLESRGVPITQSLDDIPDKLAVDLLADEPSIECWDQIDTTPEDY